MPPAIAKPAARMGLATVIALAYAGIVVAIYYPGWLFLDPALQWAWAAQISQGVWPFLSTQWPITDTLIKVPFYFISNEPGLYAFVQVFLFALVVIAFIRQRAPRAAGWVAAAIALLMPTLMNYAVLHSADTLIVMGMLAMFVTERSRLAPREKLLVAFALGLLLFLIKDAAVIFGGAALVAIAWGLPLSRRFKAAVVVAFVLVVGIIESKRYDYPIYFDTSTYAPAVKAALIDEMAGDIGKLTPLYGGKPIPHFGEPCFDQLMYCAAYIEESPRFDLDPGLSRAAKRLFVDAVMQHPKEAFIVLTRIALAQLGFTHTVPSMMIGRWDVKPEAPMPWMDPTPRRLQLVEVNRWWETTLWGAFARPYLMILFGILGLILLGWREHRNDVPLLALSVAVYIGPLLLMAPSYDLRYMLPGYLPFLLHGLMGTMAGLGRLLPWRSGPAAMGPDVGHLRAPVDRPN